MRTIERSYGLQTRLQARGQGPAYGATLGADLVPVLVALANDDPLEPRHRDHDLSGDWAGYRECHVKPDLLLIYRKTDANTLRISNCKPSILPLFSPRNC
jgi:mRNA interferase YafQ